jgi:acetyl esterase/lipase
MKHSSLALLVLTGTLVGLLIAAGGPRFAAANAPALFGNYHRIADLNYGAGARQRLDVYAPPGAHGRPIVVFWYGGGWQRGEKVQYRFVGAALAEAGFVAVLPDYRLYPEVRFPEFLHDGAAALAWVVSHAEQIGGDPSRIYLAGHSAGAWLAAMLAYDRLPLEELRLPARTVRGFIGLSGPYALDPTEQQYRVIFTAPYSVDDWQPARQVHAGAPPALLIHGGADQVVEPEHARTMQRALQAQGVAVSLLIYPGRDHGDTVAAFARLAPDKLPVIEAMRRFIDGPASR